MACAAAVRSRWFRGAARPNGRSALPGRIPALAGSFLPERSEVKDDGFSAHYAIANLALGQAMVMANDPAYAAILARTE